MKTIAISIVTYNSQDVFETLDNIVTKIMPYIKTNIYVFDNNSSDEYKKKLKSYGTQMSIHYHHENMGFGFGHNYNASKCNDEYFIVYNPDILADHETLIKMHDFMEDQVEVGMCVPKVLNKDGSIQYLIRKRLNLFDYMLRFIPFKFIRRLFDKRLANYECRDLSDERQEILFGSGCFMFFRTSIFKKIKGFDERFFMYFEDNDICQRLRAANEKIYYLPDATVIHFYAKGAHKSKKLFSIFIKSMVQYFNKWGWTFF
ncbi:glycosyltransferase family 2 protein [Vagococcus sp. BWB3-3]|uniref:Glycosyltransferase family 2 protein n=1 Tax=Vagococcus allomyrinae TaxID=2794353 RepID=A0A940SWV9_9ENTE|nr:glycosyltransferase family 2 protein [Vagococcus allomyrinae]